MLKNISSHATGWSCGYAFVYGAGSLSFKSREVKWGAELPAARHRCDIFLKEALLRAGAMTRRWAPQTRYTFQDNTTSI